MRLLRMEGQVLAWLQPGRPEWFAPGRFPVFNLDAAEGRAGLATGNGATRHGIGFPRLGQGLGRGGGRLKRHPRLWLDVLPP